jgi:5-methylcytosine-specific restriction endonuclease McrA
MLTLSDYELAIFRRRSQTIYGHQGRRARADRQTLDYTLEEFRAFLRQQGGHCAYCGCRLGVCDFSADHANPTSRSANYGLSNLAICCKRCNEIKGRLTAEEFLELLALIHRWAPVAQHDLFTRLRSGGGHHTRYRHR